MEKERVSGKILMRVKVLNYISFHLLNFMCFAQEVIRGYLKKNVCKFNICEKFPEFKVNIFHVSMFNKRVINCTAVSIKISDKNLKYQR